MRTWMIVAVVLVAVVLTGLSFGRWSSGVPVEVAKVTRGPIREYIDEEAKTRLAETYLVTMPYAGRIEAIELPEGTQVKTGQAVARIVRKDLELNVAAAQAAIERLKASIVENGDTSVEETGYQQALSFVESMDRTVEAATARVTSGLAKLDYAEKSLARIRRAFDTKAKTQDELDQAQVSQVESSVDYQQDVLVQRAMQAMQAATALMPTSLRQYIKRKTLSTEVLNKQLQEAQVQLDKALQEQERGTMSSPIDGVVLERLVSNERQLPAGELLLRIGRWEDLQIEADVLSQEVVRIKPGNLVEVSGPAIGTPTAKATIDRIYPAGFTKVSSLGVEQQRVKTIARFDSIDLTRLRTERDLGVDYRVRVRVFTAEKESALVVPRSALFRGPTGEWRVFAVRDGKAVLERVTLGLANDERAEVTSGLAEGDQVVLAPETTLTAGQAVHVVVQETPEN